MSNWTPPEDAVEVKSWAPPTGAVEVKPKSVLSAEKKVAQDIARNTAKRKSQGLSTYYSPEKVALKVKLENQSREKQRAIEAGIPEVTQEEQEAYKRYSSNNAVTKEDVDEVRNKALEEKSFKTIGDKRRAESLTSVGAAIENWWEGDADKEYVAFEDERKQVLKEAKREGKKYTDAQIENLTERKFNQRQYKKLINKKAEQYLKDISGEEQDLLESKGLKDVTIETKAFNKRAAVNKKLETDITNYSKAYDTQLKEIKAYGKEPKLNSQEEVTSYNEKVQNLNRIAKELTPIYSTYKSNLTEYDRSSKKLGTAEEEYDLAKRHYGVGWNLLKTADAFENFFIGAAGLAGMAGDLATYVPRKVADLVTGDDETGFMTSGTEWLYKRAAQREEEQNKFYAKDREVEGVETFFEKGWDLVATQIPNIVLFAVSGGTGNVAKVGATEVAGSVAKAAVDDIAIVAGKKAVGSGAKYLEQFANTRIGKTVVDAATLKGFASKAIAGSSAGTKYLDLNYEKERGNIDYNPLQMMGASLLYGYAEGVGENVTMDIFKGATRPLKALAEDGAKKAFLDTLKKETVVSWFGQRGRDMLNENISEQVTNLAQNGIDKFMLGKNVGMLDNTGTVFKDTTMLTALMIGSPAIAGQVIRPFIPVSDQSKMKSNSSEMARLISKMNGASEITQKAYQDKVEALTKENSEMTKKTIDRIGGIPNGTYNTILELDKGRRDIQVRAHDILNSNESEQDKANSLNILKEEYDAKDNELAVIQDNIKLVDNISSDFDAETKEDIYNSLVERKELEQSIKTMDPMQKQDALEKIKEIDDTFKAYKIRSIVEKEIVKDFNKTLKAKEQLGLDKLFMPDIGTSKSAVEWLQANTKLTEDEIEEQSGKYGFFVPAGLMNDVIDPETGEAYPSDRTALIVNREESSMKGMTTTGQHEMLHALLYNAVKGNPEFIRKIGSDLYTFLETTLSKEVLEGTEFKERHDGYKADFITEKKSLNEKRKADIEDAAKKTNSVKIADTAEFINAKYNALINLAEAGYLEETLTLLSEAISRGDIKYNETFFTKLGDLIRRVFQNYGLEVNFSSGQDVFNFVRDYNRSFEKGKFTNAFKALAIKREAKIGKESIKSSKASVDEIQKKIDKLEDQFDNDDIDYDDYTSRLKTYKDDLNKAKLQPEVAKPEVKAPKTAVTEEEVVKEIIRNEKGTIASDKVQKIYDEKGIQGANEIIKLFKPITAKIVQKRRDAPGYNEEELTKEIELGVGGLFYLIKDYNAAKGVPLAAYINKNLPLRAITASRRILDTNFTSDVSAEVNVKATETADQNMTERVAEKPKYKNALESNVFEPVVIESIKGKILSTVRLLRNRIDATVTLNRTVTPVIAEIRDEMGKQADIDVKTAMGGKKDGQLKNFLLKNKRYILENMTTTWLMGKDGQGGIPIAIQKRIDGRWVNFPDWVGKKIDRESMSTDSAGRTSGTELARRLPSAANNISDADFLAQIIGPDGNPLRGRKESLAKAIAEEVSFDLILEDLAYEGVIHEAMQANQVRLQAELKAALAIEFQRQAERGNIKNSGPSAIAIQKREMAIDLSNRGVEFEQQTIDRIFAELKKLGAKTKIKLLTVSAVGANSNAVDLQIESNGRIYNIELKLDKYAQIGSVTFRNIVPEDNRVISIAKPIGEENAKTILNGINANAGLKEYFNKAIEYGAARNRNGNLVMSLNAYMRLQAELYQDKASTKIDLVDSSVIQALNAGKSENKRNIAIAFGDVGAYAYEKDNNPLALEVLKGPVTFIIRAVRGATNKNTGNVTVYFRGFPKMAKEWNQTSNFNVTENVGDFLKNIEKSSLMPKPVLTPQREIDLLNAMVESVKSSSGVSRGISVFDFDDTVGLTNSNVLYTMPDGTTGKLTGAEFAKRGSDLLEQDAEFDFSEFSKVVDGKPGPMVEKMKKMIGKFGPENFFILTARPADSAGPIHQFLASIGIDIPLENITGLGNSTAQAKADWIVSKVAKGYNDFYFADDHLPNVQAVKNALDVFDVKSKIQQARIKSSKGLSESFNKIIEVNTGMEDFKVFSDIVAKRRGAGIGKYRFFLPPSAEDFTGLLYDFLGKGKAGEEQFAFFKKNLIDPYVKGTALIDSARQSIKRDYKALLAAFPEVRKKLGKKIPSGDFTYDQAIRVSIWEDAGLEVPGLSRRDTVKLNELVANDPELSTFKANLIVTGRQGNGWVAPAEFWDANTIISDLHNITEKVGRKKFLEEFIENVNEIFSKDNLNKIEAIYGSNFRESLEDSVYRMSNGTNRTSGSNRLTNQWNNWVNNSTGAIMFFNTRSALLQVISGINFINWSDNNPASAALAFANQKQYWKDFAYIFNSDKMKERRSGLKEDVSAAEIANAAEGSKNKVGAVLSYLLKIGFTPTQIADSFAISAGGSTFYRNRIKTYIKNGLSETEAEAEAWKDFSKTADENQQSSDPMLISQQQTSSIGRLILAFQNTPMQYNRLMKKAARDLINRRGNSAEHISKILYYGAVQSFIFNALQSALFAVAFTGGDDEEKDKEINKKSADIIDGMIDGIIRGSGLGGAIVVTLKNAIQKYQEESEKGFKGDNAKVLLQLLNISPAIGSKASKIYGSMQTAIFEKEVMKEMGWSVTRDGRLNVSPIYEATGALVEGTTNIPMSRLVSKVENMSEALDSRNATWQRVASALGWKPYAIGVPNEEQDLIKAGAKVRKKAEGVEKAKITRLENKLKELDMLSNMTTEEYDNYLNIKKLERRLKYLDKKIKDEETRKMLGK